jgi:hypothetical protein
MGLLAWDEVAWPEFVAGLEGFRDHFPRAAHAPDPQPENAADIVAVLNRWACRLSSERAPGALDTWLGDHAAALEKLAPLTISDARVPNRAEQLGELHDGLILHMQSGGVRNMGPAAASKALYLLQPRLFVMWDKEISRSAPEGYGSYLVQMNALAGRLADEAPTTDVEAFLEKHLGYKARKTLAKYLDEYNWFEAVGRRFVPSRHPPRAR